MPSSKAPSNRTPSPPMISFELGDVLYRAGLINAHFEKDFDLSFTSVLLGFLASNMPLSRWFQRYVNSKDIDLEGILASRKITRETLAEIAKEQRNDPNTSNLRQTSSTHSLLNSAAELLALVDDRPQGQLDERHVMAAYIYRPGRGHEQQLIDWGFDRIDWSTEFLKWISSIPAFHTNEFKQWSAIHRETFGEEPDIPEGPEDSQILHDQPQLLIDSPATEDFLGRKYFAETLAVRMNRTWKQIKQEYVAQANHANKAARGSFMLHLHGSWGSGKTSLLNFLRQNLQQKHADNAHRSAHSESDDEPQWIVVDFNAWQHQRIEPPWWPLIDSVYRQSRHQLPSLFGEHLRGSILGCREWWWRVSTGRKEIVWAMAISLLILTGSIYLIFHSGANSAFDRIVAAAKSVGAAVPVAITVWSAILLATRSLISGTSRSAQAFMQGSGDPMERISQHFRDLAGWIKKPIVVFIDDLDRCQYNYVVTLLEGIQTLFNDPRVFYVISADRRWLHASFEKIYAPFADAVREPGRQLGSLFLEKAFELSVGIPRLSPERRKMYWDYLAVGVTQNPKSLEQTKIEVQKEFSNARTEGQVLAKLNETSGDFFRDELRRGAAVRQLATQKVVESTEYFLKPFAALTEPNPRAMKRLINAYTFLRDSAVLAGSNVLFDTEARRQLALWAIVSLRWPVLKDYVEEHLERHPDGIPDVIDLIRNGGPITDANVELQMLTSSAEVIKVFNGSIIGTKLDRTTVCSLAGIGGATSKEDGVA